MRPSAQPRESRSKSPHRQTTSETARWTAVSVFALSSAWNYLDRLTLSAAAPRIKAEFHLNNTDYGWLLSAFSVAYTLASPFVGWLLDRIGVEAGIVWVVALWSLATALTGWSRSLWQLVLARVFLGIWESAGVPAAGKLNAIYLAPKNRAVGAAMTQIGLSIAGVGAPLLVGAVAGWRSPFFICAALGLAWIPVWMLVRARVRPYEEVPPQGNPGMWRLLKDKRLLLLAGANILWMGIYTLWSNWTTVFLTAKYGLTTQNASWYAWVPPIAATLGGFAGGWISKRAIERGAPAVKARVFGTLISAVGCLLTVLAPLSPTPLCAMAAISASYFAVTLGSVNLYTIPVDIWGGEHAGTAISALVFAYGLLQTGISPVIGSLVDHVGFTPVCWMVALPPLGGWILLRRSLYRDV
ncbi:MAG: MFS transporter [Acidobacteriota bacterium]|nr:MFS transporter [Acidobacteriota bacterium]